MTQIISFPGLGWEFSVNGTAITLFGLSIKWYGVIFALAFLFAVIYVLRRTSAAGLNQDHVIDVLLGTVLFGFVGARIYFVLLKWDQYSENLIDIFKVWNGGIAMYGGVIAALIAGYFLCKWRKVKFLPLFDLCAPALLLAQSIGRWGNFVNGEAFGSATDLPWRMFATYENGGYYTQIQRYLYENLPAGQALDGSIGVHPTFFYESVWCLIGFALLAWYYKKRKFDGEIVLLYIIWYGLGRSVIEGLRTDSLVLGTIRVSQIVGILSALVAIIIFFVVRGKIKNNHDPEYLKLYVYSETAQLVIVQELEKKLDRQKGSRKFVRAPKSQSSEETLTEKNEEEQKDIENIENGEEE